jgi:transglutaminase-like putative cysteine protease
MRDVVRRYKRHPQVRGTATDLVRDLPQKDRVAEVTRIFGFVRDRIRYVRDVRGVETMQTPDATLDVGQGDCDDKSILLAALLESVGYPTRFVAIGYRPGRFTHVYVETLLGLRWVPLDSTEPNGVGWAPRPAPQRMVVTN